ncbi:unnamed protein product, partial [Eruca vesicaria subsp. sativa]|nr:unnamed protein product [Eruca vesicaria subsp. sativa]
TVKKGDTIFVGYLFTGTEITSVWLEIMVRKGDEAAAQEDEKVGKEHEVEWETEPELDFEKQKEKEEKQKALKEKEMINSAVYKEREMQKQEEVKLLRRVAAEAGRKRTEE